MADNLEKTGEAQRGHDLAMEKTQVYDGAKHDLYGRNEPIDWGDDADTPLACPVDPDGPCEVCG
jgi:hypothetical protein